MKPKRNNEEAEERVDINLDEEPIGDAELAAMASAEAAAGAGAPQESEEDMQDALVAQLAKLQAEKDDLQQTLVRRQADFENYRKRIERERQEDGRRAMAIFVEGLLPVLDAFERALATAGEAGNEQFRVGFELIYKQLADALARQGLERIPAKGAPFDPFVHQAIERVETADAADGVVLEELQPGYKFKGMVVRPAMVRVAAAPTSADSNDPLVN